MLFERFYKLKSEKGVVPNIFIESIIEPLYLYNYCAGTIIEAENFPYSSLQINSDSIKSDRGHQGTSVFKSYSLLHSSLDFDWTIWIIEYALNYCCSAGMWTFTLLSTHFQLLTGFLPVYLPINSDKLRPFEEKGPYSIILPPPFVGTV